MERYIDLEEFAKRINENIKPETIEEKELIEWCKDECIRQGYAMPTADVSPKSEVASMPHKCKDCAGCTQWKCDCSLIEDNAKTEVAKEIFEEIEKQLAMYSHIHKYAEEANKVTEEYADGSPVEMTSVWDACRLEHNGYDDYETMCKLQDNIGYIAKSMLLKEFEGDIAELKKKYTEDSDES